jgi:zinc/manganese transport system substrate-binding protein
MLKIFIALLILSSGLQNAEAKLRVVSTLPVFASIAESVGGDLVEVTALSSGQQDPHHLVARQSFVRILARADVFIEAGLDLEHSWSAPLLSAAGNRKILKGAPGYVQTHAGITLLEILPAGADRSWGDIHIHGNPHYWLDPVNGIIIARNIMDTFIKVDPGNAAAYRRNYQSFNEAMRSLTAQYLRHFEPFFGSRMVVHHREWAYLFRRFRLIEAASIEEKMGVEPGMTYVNQLIQKLRVEKPDLIIIAPYNPERYAKYMSQETGVPYAVVPTDISGNIKNYQGLIRTMLDSLLAVLKK